MAFDVLFYAGLLRTIGVEVDYVREGSYKSAVEPYTRTEMSPELERTMKRLLDDLYDQMVVRIAAGRDMTPSHVRDLIDGGPYSAREAAENGLVDALVYEDELEAWLDEALGADVVFERATEPRDAGKYAGVRRIFELWQRSFRTRARSGSPREKIALIRVDGMIVTGGSEDPYRQGDFITAGAITYALATAAEDETVKAIVLRVDSPGGSALASDVIWRAVIQARLEKPVIASMGGVAASGGYYVAMAADHILADEGTLTGSIGVFGAKFNLGGLYDKVGIRKQILTRGRNAALYDEAHGFTPSERERVSGLIRQIYEDFVSKAADARDMTVDELDAVAQGQVWTGREALAHGLIDGVGGLKRAFAVAKVRAGYPPDMTFELLELPEVPSLLDLILRDGFSSLLSANSGLALTTEREWFMPLVALSRERAFAMLPYAFTVR